MTHLKAEQSLERVCHDDTGCLGGGGGLQPAPELGAAFRSRSRSRSRSSTSLKWGPGVLPWKSCQLAAGA
jgi:hypothetical protein